MMIADDRVMMGDALLLITVDRQVLFYVVALAQLKEGQGGRTLILFADVIIVQIQIGFFGDYYAGVAQYLAQSEHIHAVHQAAFRKVVTQTVWGVLFVQVRAFDILLEVVLKIADTD